MLLRSSRTLAMSLSAMRRSVAWRKSSSVVSAVKGSYLPYDLVRPRLATTGRLSKSPPKLLHFCTTLPYNSTYKYTSTNRSDLDSRREFVGVRKHQPREKFVFLKIAGQQDQFGTEPPRRGGGHRCVDAELPCLVTSRGNNAAFFAPN